MDDPRNTPPVPDFAPLPYEPREAAVSAGLPRLAMVLALAPMVAATAATAWYVLTGSDAIATAGLVVAAGGVGCILASAALTSMWLARAQREGVPEDEAWYRRRRISVAMFVNLPVAMACVAIGSFWGSSVLVTVTNTATAPLHDVHLEFVGATKKFGDLPPGQSRSRRFFPGSGRLAAEWTIDGERHSFTIDDPADFHRATIIMDGEGAHRK